MGAKERDIRMKITNEMIYPEIRRAGVAMRKIFTYKNEQYFFRAQRTIKKIRGLMKPKNLKFAEKYIKTPENLHLRLCICSAQSPQPNAIGLLWIHGGGFAIGTPELDVRFAEKFIDAANCVVILPDYRLSTEAPYPAAIDDCYRALLWMREHGEELGICTDQLFVGGDSAGGGLTAAVTLMARDKGKVKVAFQMPFYPMLDDRMITESSRDNDAPLWNTRANEMGWKMYLGDLYGTEKVPAYAAPARADNYAGLPPTYTFVGTIEPFYDETKKYISDLQAAGVQAEIDVYPGCFHGFDNICAKSEIARRAARKYIEKFKYAAENYSAPQD